MTENVRRSTRRRAAAAKRPREEEELEQHHDQTSTPQAVTPPSPHKRRKILDDTVYLARYVMPYVETPGAPLAIYSGARLYNTRDSAEKWLREIFDDEWVNELAPYLIKKEIESYEKNNADNAAGDGGGVRERADTLPPTEESLTLKYMSMDTRICINLFEHHWHTLLKETKACNTGEIECEFNISPIRLSDIIEI